MSSLCYILDLEARERAAFEQKEDATEAAKRLQQEVIGHTDWLDFSFYIWQFT